MSRYAKIGAWALALLVCSTGHSLTFEVTTWRELPGINPGDGTALTEGGEVSLRSALQEANAQPGPDRIEFTDVFLGSISVTHTLSIEDDLVIVNHPGFMITLQAEGSTPFRFFEVAAGTTLLMDSVFAGWSGETLIRADVGAMMYVAPGAVVELRRGQFIGGVAESHGGCIYLDRATAIVDGTFDGVAGRDGGGIYNDRGTVILNSRLSGSGLAGGNGGLLYNNEGTVIIHRALLGSDFAEGLGGELFSNGGTVTITAGRISSGVANAGGGIYLANGAELRMSRTEVLENTALESGAGIHIESGSLVATQCSFFENATDGPGGGVYVADGNSASFVNCTFTANTAALGGGLYVSPGATATLGNTVLAGNTAQGEYADLWGSIDTLGHNLVGVAPTGLTAFLQGTVDNPLDPMLEYYELFSSFFRYIPEAGSPLIDAGDNALLNNPAFIGSQCVDAASMPRLRNDVIDIGAAEFQGGSEQAPCGGHSADTQNTGQIDLSALLRVVQLYNAGGLHCDLNGEGGYAPGEDATEQYCTPHSSDYNPQDWRIDLNELLRVIQFFNVGGYYPCPESSTEDGFCPGISGGR